MLSKKENILITVLLAYFIKEKQLYTFYVIFLA
jgi:hypothetical protein